MAKEKMKKLYTLGEEITNSITHGIGSLLSIAALVIMIVVAAIHNNTMGFRPVVCLNSNAKLKLSGNNFKIMS